MSPAPAPHAHERVVWRGPRVLRGDDAPGLLAFRGDDFMADLEASLAADPPTAASHVAAPEHWADTQPPLFAVPTRPTRAADPDLKLYQPAHGRFYLVAAHLCCRRFGFPDRRLSASESVGFVLRRVEPAGSAALDPDDPGTYAELAWVATGGGSWRPVADRFAVAEGEEVLPLTPTVHTFDGRRSRLLAGLVPVGARERYEARSLAVVVPSAPQPDGDPLADPRRALLDGTVIDAVRQVLAMRPEDGPPADDGPPDDHDLAEMLTWALLDLVDFVTGVVGDAEDDEEAAEVLASMAGAHLDVNALPPPSTATWADVVATVAAERTDLLDGKPPSTRLKVEYLDKVRTLQLDGLVAALGSYREALPSPPAPTGSHDVVPDPDPVLGLRYVARCVYHRSDCMVQRPEWVSAPTVPFRFASFFDPDAPARPVRISLPVDTTQGGLRAFPRNVSILVSKQLRAQIQQVKGLDDIGGKQSFDLGMLCSLSIPIISICALILLMLVVAILNIVFFWMPLFKVCLPQPGGED